MTDKPDNDIDHDFSLNHFDQATDIESEQDTASKNRESFYTADLFAEAEQIEQIIEDEKEDPFDSTWGADRFAEHGYGKKEPDIPQQSEPESATKAHGETIMEPPVHTATPIKSDIVESHDPFEFDQLDTDHVDTDHEDARQPVITSEQMSPTVDHISTSPQKAQRTGIKPITVFAILAMLAAAAAIWMSPGANEHHDITTNNQKSEPLMGQNIQVERLESRISTMEQRGDQNNKALKQQLDQLQQQVSALTGLLAKLTRKRPSPRSVKQAASSIRIKPTSTPIPAKIPTGWVVNLVSVDSHYAANKALARYKSQGISTEIFPTEIKGKTWYRLRIAGFASKRDATTQKILLADKFGIKDAWIQKP